MPAQSHVVHQYITDYARQYFDGFIEKAVVNYTVNLGCFTWPRVLRCFLTAISTALAICSSSFYNPVPTSHSTIHMPHFP